MERPLALDRLSDTDIPMAALCKFEVDIVVYVYMPLTMNYRGAHISKHKDQGGVLMPAEALSATLSTMA